MPRVHPKVPELEVWLDRSPLGHVNVSPKGVAGTFKVIDNRTVMYQDLSGSGSGMSFTSAPLLTVRSHHSAMELETISHLRENGRVTVMFQEFEGAPRIVRLFGTGTHSDKHA